MMKCSKRDSKKMIKEMARLSGLSVSDVREQIQDKIIALMNSDDTEQQAEFKLSLIHISPKVFSLSNTIPFANLIICYPPLLAFLGWEHIISR